MYQICGIIHVLFQSWGILIWIYMSNFDQKIQNFSWENIKRCTSLQKVNYFVVCCRQEECELLLSKYQNVSFGAKRVSTPGAGAGLVMDQSKWISELVATLSYSRPSLGATKCRKKTHKPLLNYLKKINLNETKIFRLHFFDSSFKYNT